MEIKANKTFDKQKHYHSHIAYCGSALESIGKRFWTPFRFIKFLCPIPDNFPGHRYVESNTYAYRLFLQTFEKDWVTLRSTLNSSLVPL